MDDTHDSHDTMGPVALGSRGSPGGRPLVDLAGIVARLRSEFPAVPVAQVADVVAGCAEQLLAPHPDALPELVERLARHRLTEVMPARMTHAAGS